MQVEPYIFKDQIIFEDEFFTIGQDWEYPIPAFFILAPNRKIRSIDQFTNEESKLYIELIRRVRTGMKDILNIETVYFFQNEDTKHDYHLWIFPRQEWMEQFGKGIKSVKPIMEYAIQNMMDENTIVEVKRCVALMREFMMHKME